jgi:hypothetical protein
LRKRAGVATGFVTAFSRSSSSVTKDGMARGDETGGTVPTGTRDEKTGGGREVADSGGRWVAPVLFRGRTPVASPTLAFHELPGGTLTAVLSRRAANGAEDLGLTPLTSRLALTTLCSSSATHSIIACSWAGVGTYVPQPDTTRA